MPSKKSGILAPFISRVVETLTRRMAFGSGVQVGVAVVKESSAS